MVIGEVIVFSGQEGNKHANGVALVFSKYAQNVLIGWEAQGQCSL